MLAWLDTDHILSTRWNKAYISVAITFALFIIFFYYYFIIIINFFICDDDDDDEYFFLFYNILWYSSNVLLLYERGDAHMHTWVDIYNPFDDIQVS